MTEVKTMHKVVQNGVLLSPARPLNHFNKHNRKTLPTSCAYTLYASLFSPYKSLIVNITTYYLLLLFCAATLLYTKLKKHRFEFNYFWKCFLGRLFMLEVQIKIRLFSIYYGWNGWHPYIFFVRIHKI